ncbi:hypothetical protein ACH4YO_38105 [Streptomyces noursei]|uniref:hypothetical protein n=1 Tax=Streptomyces noursei TaxID=1971 RepID=UPI00081C8EFA|nr:membrane protein [Streptomyces noursei ATCC 11455]ANZ21953.1 membrane protein [Streptomyces noursei ATCC 11455]MCZ0996546.1 hypothetical protein [Streptomyces noursei]
MSGVDVGIRVGRSYTRARRLPWVFGKVGDWVLPFGPYTAAQIGVAFVGGFVLIKTFSWWRVLGPVPVVVLVVAVWAVRRARIGGRTPFNLAVGVAARIFQPRGGRVDGRAMRPPRPQVVYGGCVIEEVSVGVADDVADRAAVGGKRGLGALLRGVEGRLPREGRRKPLPPPQPRPVPTAMQQILQRRDARGGDGGMGA